eukprot:31033-Pelagococcus_subviridis.AAC.8
MLSTEQNRVTAEWTFGPHWTQAVLNVQLSERASALVFRRRRRRGRGIILHAVHLREPPFLPKHRRVVVPRPTPKPRALVIRERPRDLASRVHHERAVLRDGFPDGPPLQNQHHRVFARVARDAQLRADARVELDGDALPQRLALASQRAPLEKVRAPVRVAADARGRQRERRTRFHRHKRDHDVVGVVRGPALKGRRPAPRAEQLPRPHDRGRQPVRALRRRDVLAPVHDERGVRHLTPRRKVEPNLKQSQRVGRVRVHEREHLAVDDALTRGHPLHVAVAVPPRVPDRVRVIHEAYHRRGDRLEPAVRMLRESGDSVAVVHSVRAVRVEVRAVASSRRAELVVPGGVVVVVIHREQERVGGLEREPERLHLRRRNEGRRRRAMSARKKKHDGRFGK